MTSHHELLEKLYQKLQDQDTRCAFFDKMEMHINNLAEKNPKIYQHMLDKIEGIVCSIDLDEAEMIVRKMTPRGQQWSYSDVQRLIKQGSIQGDPIHYYLALNMAYNDYYETAARFGLQSNPEFYIAIAKDFVNDPDGVPHKIERYFKG